MKTYIVIGSGIAGSTITKKLLDHGNRVHMIEIGPTIKMRDQGALNEIITTGVAPYDGPSRDVESDYHNTGKQRLVFPNSRLFARGGTTLHWTGSCPRLKPEDFRKKSNTGKGFDWPISYEEIEDYYYEAEEWIGVSGDHSRNSCPRKKPYPLPRIDLPMLDQKLAQTCEKIDWSWEQMPIARITAPYPGRTQCQTTGVCKYCPFGARFSADMLIDEFQENKNFSYINAAVKKIVLEKGRARGIICSDDRRIDADRVIVCAGAIESTKILMLSGIGNHSNHLGRHLACHPFPKLWIGLKENSEQLFQEIHFPIWTSRQFDSPERQASGKLLMFIPPAGPHLSVPQLIANGRSFKEIQAASTGPNRLLLVGLFEMDPSPNSRISLAKGITRFGLPRTEVHLELTEESLSACFDYEKEYRQLAKSMGLEDLEFSVDQSTKNDFMVRADHVTGISRATVKAEDGVVDQNLRVHEVENVWVCSNGVFPTNGAANPTLTLTALALRLSKYLTVS